ncbi:hypothetical protein CCHL11_00661 [Colletotrichum chlorophyti]|uniref:Uncharacterized protein n=1 Tax=Colletotrichum chlorophyti TaxID=708187 RepID=A0A1Q8S4R5_9PEZI|nr:hypothetical protein CCHL11_00661 [Colletotrichum chlorophyti]
MVSFFGLKLGADKKKKSDRVVEQKPQWKRVDQNTLGEGQFFGSNLQRPVLINGTRPSTAMSNKSFAADFRHPNAPYLNGGSSSLVDLGAPGGKGGIRSVGSEANLNMRWNNGSMMSVHNVASPPIITGGNGQGNRPLTPNSISTGRKAWVNPLDVHFARSGSGPRSDGALSPAPSTTLSGHRSPSLAPSISPLPTPTVANAPRSPLGQFEFNLNPSDKSKTNELTPAPLSPTKSYPSPPQSVTGSLPPLKTDLRPKTAVSTVRDAHRPGPASLPSPTASVGRTSDEERLYSRPIIQNVAAKRDTLTITTPRRQSFSMDITEDPIGLDFGFEKPPAASVPASPPPRSALRPSPPELRSLPKPSKSAGIPPQRPRQVPFEGPLRSASRPTGDTVPYEGPLRSPARPPEDFIRLQERMSPEKLERTKPGPRERMNSDARERTLFDSRERHDLDAREVKPPDNVAYGDHAPLPQGYLGPPPAARRTAPGEGERSYGITPANRRPPPPPVQLQRKASNPQFRLQEWDDQDVHHGNFAMISPPMQSPLPPPTPNGLLSEPSSDANWPLPSPLASPTFGTGRRPYTPSERSEGQLSPGLVMPLTPGHDSGRDMRDARDGGEGRRPDFGLRAPTGIADEFRIGFI